MPKDKLKAYVMLRQDLLEEKKQLEERLNEINLVLEGTSPLPLKAKRGRPAGKAKAVKTPRAGKMTTNASILKALDDGVMKSVTDISQAVEKLKGKVSKPSISIGLAKLKKEGKILSPKRGIYVKK